MKKIILIIAIALCISSCATTPKERNIPYSVSIDAEYSIFKAIQNLKQDKISFYLEHISDDKFQIHLLESINENYSFSNRKLFINDKFYPLIFDTDYLFFVKTENGYPIVTKFENDDEKKFEVIKTPSISERFNNKSLYARDMKINRIDWSIYWIVDSKGNLLETNSKK